MAATNWIAVITFLFAFSTPVQAQTTELSNLIRESESLAILNEQSVQHEVIEAKRLYSIKMGVMSASRLLVSGETQSYGYDVSSETPVIGASFGLVPWRGRNEVGFDFGVAYFTEEGQGLSDGEAAQLHVAFLEPSIFLQHHLNSIFAPRLGAGYGVAAVFQRGFSDENTSTALGFGFVAASLGFNLSQFQWFKGDLDWSLNLEHRRNFGGSSTLAVSELHKSTLGFVLRL